MNYFENKIIWLTGASSGIGEALVYELNLPSSTLILSARNQAALEAIKSRCPFPQNIHIFPLDLEQINTLEPIVQKVITTFGRVDILINNGGISQRALAKDTSIETMDKLLKVNFLSHAVLSKLLLPYMIQQRAGHIVVTSSLVGKFGAPMRSMYAASKHALHGFFDTLRLENQKHNIHVTIVCPGFIKTNISLSALTADGSQQNTMDKNQANGMPAHVCAKKMANAIAKQQQEIVVGGMERFSVLFHRFFPKLFYKLIAPK